MIEARRGNPGFNLLEVLRRTNYHYRGLKIKNIYRWNCSKGFTSLFVWVGLLFNRTFFVRRFQYYTYR